MIPFNKPYCSGRELKYIERVCHSETMSGNGEFTKKCHTFFEQNYGFNKCLLTTSGTDALEMCAMLCELQPGDEVIVPSYTFVSTALAFLREGAKVVFADSSSQTPNMEAEQIEPLITDKTKVIAVVHYAGVACDMDKIMALAEKHNLLVVEDAAHAIDSYYDVRGFEKFDSLKVQELAKQYDGLIPLGGIGHLGAFSFHETKNISSGEGGMICINDKKYLRRAEIIWEKGTNRAEFYRGMVNKYGWVDMGSSFLPAEINAAFLWAQLENLNDIQNKRKSLWKKYYEGLLPLEEKGLIRLPELPDYATNNGHIFYVVCCNLQGRTELIKYLKGKDILAPFHFLSLHKSEYNTKHAENIPELPNCDMYADCLVRMPMFYELTIEQVEYIVDCIKHAIKSDDK